MARPVAEIWVADASKAIALVLLVTAVPGTLYVLTAIGPHQRQTLQRPPPGRPLRDPLQMKLVLTAVVVLTGTVDLVHLLIRP